MGETRVAPTRSNLLRLRRRLRRVERGGALLRRKREALVAEIFRHARPAVDARSAIEEAARTAYDALVPALAADGRDALRVEAWPGRSLPVRVETGRVWGVDVTSLEVAAPVRRSLGRREAMPPMTTPAAAAAAGRFETVVELLLAAAHRELLIRRLGAALAETSRQVENLERRVAPRLARELATVAAVLEERDREDRARLRSLQRKRELATTGNIGI